MYLFVNVDLGLGGKYGMYENGVGKHFGRRISWKGYRIIWSFQM